MKRVVETRSRPAPVRQVRHSGALNLHDTAATASVPRHHSGSSETSPKRLSRLQPTEPEPPEKLNLPSYVIEQDLIGKTTSVHYTTRSGVGINRSTDQ